MRKTFSLPVAATAAGGGPTPPPADTVDNIEHSVRFNSADSAYMSRTPSSAGNRKTWTWAGWVKRSVLASQQAPFTSSDGTTATTAIYFSSTDKLVFYTDRGGVITVETDGVLRDPSAWYHAVIAVDTTQATSTNRIKIYLNGVQQTLSGTYPAQNFETEVNRASFSHKIGGLTSAWLFNGYLANVHFVDGQALTPSSFGFTDSNGVWQPKSYSGSYGTNGFYLDFADTSSATALGNDVSGNNNDWTPSGLVAGPAYTANSWSTEFDGSGDYLDIPSSTALGMEAEDFTYEAWVYVDETVPSNAIRGLLDSRVSGATGCGIYTSVNAGLTAKLGYATNTAVLASSTNTIASFVWSHIAVTRSGGTVRGFINGNLEFTVTDSRTFSSSAATRVATDNGQLGYFNGKISNVRIIKGRALYTAAFTPPSTALTATDDTVLLTCQDATVRDNSNIGHDVTASGDVAVVNEGPFNGYSGSFDGSGDYLTISNNSDHDLGSGDFTIEGWFKTSATVSYQTIMHKYFGPTAYDGWYIALDSNGTGFSVTLGAGSSPNLVLTGGSNLNNGAWHHFAVTRSSNTARLFLDGSLITSANSSNNITATSDLRISGIAGNPRDWNGQLSNIRIVKGQALYTSDFTPATADFTTTSQGATASNVKLLTCQDSTFIDNSPSAHTITANGDASTISVNPHTDKYSVTFDGTGDYLITPQSSDWLYTGDYTIEFWLYQSVNQEWCVYDTGGAGSADQFVHIGGTVYWGYGTTDSVTGSFSLGDINQWIHWAVTRSGNVTRMFKNGVVVDTNTAGPAANIGRSNADLWIGARRDPAYYVNGKVSNLRVTNGQALYTSNFLPTKEDFTTTSQGATASNVKLLTCQSYKIQDNSPSAHTITVNGDAAPSTDAPFVTSGAGSFDGTGDYLSIPNSSDFAFGTGDFTVEMWVYYTGTFGGLVAADQTGAGYWASLISSDTLYWQSQNGSTNLFSTSYTNYEGKWTHVAFVRNSGTTSVYLNGTYITGAADSTNYNATGGNIDIGRDLDNVSYLTGKLSNVRISKGLARYTSNFTPPTEDFDPTDQDTTFLALQGNTLDDLSGNDHAVTANGNAATSTVSPFEPVDGSDAMLDSPTNYGSGDTVRGNYCTLNPLNNGVRGIPSNGNLEASLSGSGSSGNNTFAKVAGTVAVSSGKYYWECVFTDFSGSFGGAATCNYGIAEINSTAMDSSVALLASATGGVFLFDGRTGNKIENTVSTAYAATYTYGDILSVALDLDAGTLTFYKNGSNQGTAFTGLSGTYIPVFDQDTTANSCNLITNFGQQPFKYPAPAGYKSLCSTNLPTPAIADGSTAMDVKLYTGNGSTQTISGLDFSPDLVWIKMRSSGSYGHRLVDTVRGSTLALRSHSTGAEITETTGLTAFTSDGFSLGSQGDYNLSAESLVAWAWDAGSSTVSNTDGAITSQVRANPTAGISVVSYTGTLTSAGNTTVGHGLSNAPALVITKGRNETAKWVIQSSALGTNEYLEFSTLNAQNSATVGAGALPKPTSSVFYTSWLSGLGGNGINHIAYCFAPVEGFSSFGSYTGSTSLPFVYTGFRPRWIMIKNANTIGLQSNSWWMIVDTERSDFNDVDKRLHANNSNSEYTSSNIMDICSNGFKLRSSADVWNYAGGTYIYAAFAEHPFKTSRAR